MVEFYIKSLIILLFVSGIECESYVTYDFETDFYNTFTNNKILCNGLPSWNTGNYSLLDIKRPSSESEVFITPNEFLSCVSSFVFQMEATGVLEVIVYMESVSQRDQFVILAQEAVEGGLDPTYGTTMLSPLSSNFHDGWHIVRMTLFGTGTFNGYISFLGSAAEGSTLIVDSFRYIPPSINEDDCEVYEELIIQPPATDIEESGDCIALSFDQEFDVTFDSDRGLCQGLLPWSLKNYSSISIPSPSAESLQFITPGSFVSCVSSFPFLVEAGGILEVNIYMESASEYDQIGVLTSQFVADGNDAVIGTAVFTPLNEDYTDGWNVLKVTLSGEGVYEGYVSFLGVAAEESIVLIDSFRYIPPTMSQENCEIYEDADFGTNPPLLGDECVTYNFETDFDTAFDTNNKLCAGYDSWHLGNYYSLAIESISSKSTTFIAPNETSSCVSSFTFPMKPGGTVEVNVFMESVSNLDYIIVLAKKVVPNGVDTVAGFELYYSTNANFVQGWNILKVSVIDFNPFNGYITLIGSTAEESIGLIDSFRYIPPNSDASCEIY